MYIPIPIPIFSQSIEYIIIPDSGINSTDLIQAICSILTFFLALFTLPLALKSLKQTQLDAHTTRVLFEVQNRPYLGVPPGHINFNLSEDNVNFQIFFHIMNYGHLPAVVLRIAVVAMQHENDSEEKEENLMSMETRTIVFPNVEYDVFTVPMPLEKIAHIFKDNLIAFNVIVLYATKEDQEPVYAYYTMRELDVTHSNMRIVYERSE